VFDDWYINAATVVATGEKEWRIEGNNGQGILSQQGNNLLIQTQGASGNVVVKSFFNQDNFLNVTLPEYDTQMQNMQFFSESNKFIDMYDRLKDTPMVIELVGNFLALPPYDIF